MISNQINGKKYIGQHKSQNINDSYMGSGIILKKAFKKYGKKHFKKTLLEKCYSLEEMDKKEIYYIKIFNAVLSPYFYNLASGGSVHLEFLPLEKRKSFIERMRESALNRDQKPYRTLEFRKKLSKLTKGENNGMYGKIHSKETINKILTNRNRDYNGVNNPNYGKKGNKAKNGKAVLQYEDRNFTVLIKEHHTLTQLLEYLNIKGHSALYRAIRNKTKYKNYYWKKKE